MLALFRDFWDVDSLSPHGICLLWRPELIWTHVLSDALIGLSYLSISLALGYFVLKRKDIAFGGMLWSFAIFILACGTTHLFSILTLWVPLYGVEALIKVVTAAASITTAVALWDLLPHAITLPSPDQLRFANEQLSLRVAERDHALADLERSTAERMRVKKALRESQIKAAKAALRESQGWLQTVSDIALAGLIVVDADHRIRYVNRAYAVLFNLALGDLEGRGLKDILPTIYEDVLRPRIDAAFAGTRSSHDLIYAGGAAVEARHLAKTYERSTSASGSPVVVVVVTDVTDLKRSEIAFRTSRDLLQSVLDGTMDAIFAKDAKGRYVAINESGARIIGISRDRIVGHDDEELRGADVARPFVAQDREIMRSGMPLVSETTQWICGKQTDLLVLKRPWTGVDGISGVVGIVRDVTEQNLIAAERKELAKRLMDAQEAERLRLARELHDQVGQDLTGLSLGLKQLETLLGSTEGQSRLRRLRDLTEQVARNLHRTARQLRPTSLEDLGLGGAISSHVSEWHSQFGLPVDTALDDLEAAEIGSDAQLALYRGTQEALTNILKHAKATHVSIVAKLTPDEVRLIVEDDGVGFSGFDPASTKVDHRLGLQGMRERMSQVKGQLTIESNPGAGTSIFMTVPRTARAAKALP